MKKLIMRPHQVYGYEHILYDPAVIEAGGCALYYGVGAGKTALSLMAIKTLRDQYGYGPGDILVISTKKVINLQWPKEIAQWEDTSDISYSIIGSNQKGWSEKDRIRALEKKADIHLINFENVCWLEGYLKGKWPFKIVIIDEFSAFKNRDSNRTNALMRKRPLMHLIVGLTGTPAPNGLPDLWAPMKLLDRGARLGKTIGEFRKKYLVPDKYSTGTGGVKKVTSYKVKSPGKNSPLGADIFEKIIYEKISDICISVRTEDVVDLPPKIENRIDVPFSPKLMKLYEEFEQEAVLEYMDKEITAVNAAALCQKLIQFCNGAVYTTKPDYMEIHNEKIHALEELLEDLDGSPLLTFINFQHDYERICKYLPKYKPKKLETMADIDAWNAGKVPLALLHPKSGGHGLNLQFGGNNVTWFGYTYSLELKEQGDGRVHRPGVDRGVFINTFAVPGTIEDDMELIQSNKKQGQQRLIQAVTARVDRWR